MKTILLFLLLASLLIGEEGITTSIYSSTAIYGSTAASMVPYKPPLDLKIKAGDGFIVINFATGQVTLPEGMQLSDAAIAFWLRVAQCFPECREAILTGDPTPKTVMWQPVERQPYNVIGKRDYQIGLRSDGVVAWREVQP